MKRLLVLPFLAAMPSFATTGTSLLDTSPRPTTPNGKRLATSDRSVGRNVMGQGSSIDEAQERPFGPGSILFVSEGRDHSLAARSDAG